MNNKEKFDYTNIYGTSEYNEYLEKHFMHIEDEKYFVEEEIIGIMDGFTLVRRNYYMQEEGIRHTFMSRNLFQKNGETLYSFITADGHQRSYDKLIHHRNGHRYYPFHTDLYGISYIDADTLEVYNYIPRGYENKYGGVCGESFIITNIFYDCNTDLIAYEGCYWAATSDVMVGDFTDPLNFDPHLISVHELIDSEYEEFDDVDFHSWNKETLSVKIDCDRIISVDLNNFLKK